MNYTALGGLFEKSIHVLIKAICLFHQVCKDIFGLCSMSAGDLYRLELSLTSFRPDSPVCFEMLSFTVSSSYTIMYYHC